MPQHHPAPPERGFGGDIRTADCDTVVAIARGQKATRICVILEEGSDIGALSRFLDAGLPVRAVAVTPEVCDALEARGMAYLPLSDAIDPERLFAESLALYHSVEAFSDAVDAHLAGIFPDVARCDAHPARDNFFSLYLLFDILLVRSTILKVLLEQTSPDMIIAFADDGPVPVRVPGGMPFTRDERIFPLLLRCNGAPPAVLCTGQPRREGRSPSGQPALAGRIKRDIRRHPLLRSLAAAFLAEGGPGGAGLCLALLGNLLAGKPAVAIIGFGYNWDYIFPHLVRTGYVPLHLPEGAGNGTDAPPPAGLIPADLLAAYGTLGGLDASSIIADRATPLLWDAVAATPSCAAVVKEVIRRWRPCAFLCSTKTTFREHFAARTARKSGIPVISWQHGAAGFFRYPLLAHTECANTDLHLVWGEGVRSALATDSEGASACRHEPVGSYHLQSLPDFPPPPRPFPILYVTTSYFLSHYYFGYEHRLDDIGLWHTQKTILDTIGAAGVASVLKLHPGEEHTGPLLRHLAERGISSVSVVRGERTMQECLLEAGTVIIDFPSTTLLEALASGRTVFVLLAHFVLSEHATMLLKKRAYCSDDPASFARIIGRFCRGEPLDQSPDTANTEFLEYYGIYRGDHGAAGRAVAWMTAACRHEIRQ
ncbi:MAG: hypothetical protein GKC04_00750 [Methanomicrobiales archaeon]|nr:hypothetical protein [Methanomicrobiales archaeon]